jgi:ribonuclease HI
MATENIQRLTDRAVTKQLGGSDHKPIILTIKGTCRTETRKKIASWNYKRANWDAYQTHTEEKLQERFETTNVRKNAKTLTNIILEAANKNIPRGRRHNYKPFWNRNLQELHDQASAARSKMETHPTEANITEHSRQQAIFRRTKLNCIRSSWREKTATLNMDKDSTKMWHLVKCLNEENKPQGNIVIEENGRSYTGTQASNILADFYAEESKIKMTRTRTAEVRQTKKNLLKIQQPCPDSMTSLFQKTELNLSIQNLKKKKAPGPDGVTNEMIQHLGPNGRDRVLDLFNESWAQGIFPEEWKEAEIIPIAKKGKPKTNKSSYRPISLLSCLGKVMERMVNNRLLNYLEENRLLDDCQSAFRKHRSTEDQTTYLAQEIEDAFQKKSKLLATFFDLTKAFDKVWKEGLMLKLVQKGVQSKMLQWIQNFLHGRHARVKLQGRKSKMVNITEGVPQGGVLSPTLFIIFIDDLPKIFTPYIHRALHADDLAIWTQSEYTGVTKVRMQEAINKVEEWAKTWGVQINKSKTITTLFSLSTKPENYTLMLDNTPLPKENNPVYLGLKFDQKLTWGSHIEDTERKATRRLQLMKKLSGTNWGADIQITRQVYTGHIRPTLEYGMSTYATAANTNLQKLDKIQNAGLRIITGGLKSTPITTMEATAGLQNLKERRDEKVTIMTEKFRRLKHHPMHGKIQELTTNRLKRPSFNHLSKKLMRCNEEITTKNPEEWEQLVAYYNITNTSPTFNVDLTIPGIENRTTETSTTLRTKTLDHLNNQYPSSHWIHVFTDGSSEEAIRKGGAGILILMPNAPNIELSVATGKLSTNYRAELQAILEATKTLEEKRLIGSNIVFLCDCMSVLQTIQKEPEDLLTRTTLEHLNKLSADNKVSLQWIPAHCGIVGNEMADRLAKAGTSMEQFYHKISLQEAKTLVKRKYKHTWNQRTNSNYPQDPILKLNRSQQTTIFRLRTGHCRLQAHLHKIKASQTAQCPCQNGPQTPEHILQTCPLFDDLRTQTWPTETKMVDKLWGTWEDLLLTAEFMEATHLPV